MEQKMAAAVISYLMQLNGIGGLQMKWFSLFFVLALIILVTMQCFARQISENATARATFAVA